MAKPNGPMSGFRDMLAEQMIPRQQMLQTIQRVYEGYGFTPLKTPALERYETMRGKYGEEGEKLMYRFIDQGGRQVALRYDQTVPLARVVAQYYGQLPMPYKRYVVGEVWRGDSPQAGRYREFTQFDADVVGTGSFVADAETVAMMFDSMDALSADAYIRVNNRRLLDALVEAAGITTERESRRLIGMVDKLEKVGPTAVLDEVSDAFGKNAGGVVFEYLRVDGTASEKLNALLKLFGRTNAAEEGVTNLQSVFAMLRQSGYTDQMVVFDQTIARGLDYYTGIIFETTLRALPKLGSVCSGGRYDNLVKALGGPDLPAVGTSIGVDRLYDGLLQLGKLSAVKTPTQVMIVNFSAAMVGAYMRMATVMRRAGIASELYYAPDKLGKQMKYADRLGIPYVVIVGEDEVKSGMVTLKTLATGNQVQVRLEDLVQTLRSMR